MHTRRSACCINVPHLTCPLLGHNSATALLCVIPNGQDLRARASCVLLNLLPCPVRHARPSFSTTCLGRSLTRPHESPIHNEPPKQLRKQFLPFLPSRNLLPSTISVP